MAQLSEPLARAAIDLIRTERKLGLTLNEVDQALHGWLSWNSELSGRSVAIPKNADQAELMAKVGIAWLETHAPERLKKPTQETPADAICLSCQRPAPVHGCGSTACPYGLR